MNDAIGWLLAHPLVVLLGLGAAILYGAFKRLEQYQNMQQMVKTKTLEKEAERRAERIVNSREIAHLAKQQKALQKLRLPTARDGAEPLS